MTYKESALRWFTINKFLQWRLVDENDQDKIIASENSEDVSPDESISKLEGNLDLLPSMGGGTFRLIAKLKKSDTNSERKYTFYVPKDEAPRIQAPAPTQVNVAENAEVAKLKTVLDRYEKQISALETKEKIDAALAKQKESYERKIEKLERELEEARKPTEDPVQKIVGMWGTMQAIMQGKMPMQLQQNTTPHVSGAEGRDEALRNAISKIRGVFGDDNSFLYFMQSAGEIAQNDPQKFGYLLTYMGISTQTQQPQQQQENGG